MRRTVRFVRSFRTAAVIILVAVVGTASAASARSGWSENFNAPNALWAESSTNGRFTVAFNGFGTVGIQARRLRLSPAAATTAGETHSALVTAAAPSADVDLQASVTTVAQLRTGTPPNPWEVGWLLWNFVDNNHAWYLAVKTNGWEIGRRDPSGAGGQVYITTGNLPATPVGSTRQVRIRHIGSNLTVWIDGQRIVDLANAAPIFSAPTIAFYSEDATVDFDNVSVTAP